MGTATRTTGVAQSTAAINCAFCNKRNKCANVAALKAQAQREDRVVVCGDYYPQALEAAGYREGTPRAQEHAAWIALRINAVDRMLAELDQGDTP